MFCSVESAVEQLGLPKYNPKYLMADGSKAISTAGATFLPGAKRIQCWKHVKDALCRHRGKLPCPKNDLPVVLGQVQLLQRAPTQAIYDVACRKLLEEWVARGWSKFATHFEQCCLGQYANW